VSHWLSLILRLAKIDGGKKASDSRRIAIISVFSIQSERDIVPLGFSLVLGLSKIRGREELLYFEENQKNGRRKSSDCRRKMYFPVKERANFMPTAAFYSFGCRTNKEEIDQIASQFRMNGFDIVYAEKDFACADFIAVNTCSVTQTAENKTVKFINSLKKKYPQAKIIATGCLAQQNSAKLEAVDFLVGNTRKNDIFDIVVGKTGGVFIENPAENGVLSLSKFIESPTKSDRTRLSIKIEEGCDSFCSYCIVPFLRGKPRSADFNEIITLAESAVSLGYKEIVLTGTHIGQYANSGKNFIDAAKEIISLDKNLRLRLSSMNPSDCDENLFAFLAQNPQICRHLHISVQSLSKNVLTDMNRNYKFVEDLFENLQKYRKFIPQLNLGGDFLTGFPSEREEDFLETCEEIAKFGFNYGHVFVYSARPNTSAAKMREIDEKTKKRRGEILRKLFAEQKKTFAQEQVGKTERIIVETAGELEGLTSNFLRVKGGKNSMLKKNQTLDLVLKSYNLKNNSFEADTAV